MADYNNAPARVYTAFDNRKLTLQGLDKNADGKFPSWVWGWRNNDAQITIWTNEEADKQSKFKGRIEAMIPLPLVFSLINLINMAIDAEGEFKTSLNLKDFKFFGAGKRSDEPMLLSQIFVGKDARGVIWISVTAPERPRYRFGFVPRDGYADFIDKDGNPLSAGAVSKIYARGYADLLARLYATAAWMMPTEPKKKQQNGGGGGYGGNNNGGGNNGGNRNSGGGQADYNNMDDDIPY